ncbi:MAG: electron transfer flavoprotein subunit beta/FixA family protein [Anaerolineales bacterium]|nr:MAG: electron transfer flavoprotein subunit beta/FixA family protein [Anaerolineales bacterium]
MLKVVVAIKQILNPSGFTVNRRREKIFVNREEYIINPADLNALEMALRLKDEYDNMEVMALGLGPARVDDALREAIGRGADSGVLISDPALADLKTDTAGAARLIAAALKKIDDVGLVLCGTSALDSGAGELPGRLAEVLGWSLLAEVYKIDEVDDETVNVSQRAVRLEAGLPAILTVPRYANQPRYIYGVRAINAYHEGKVVTWGLEDLGLVPDDLEPLIRLGGRRFPPERALGTRLEGSLEEAVDSLVAQLKANELI